MNIAAIPRTAARLSLGLSATFIALLAVLHVLEPEFNSGHLISEYQLGKYGLLMSVAFCVLGVGVLLLARSLGPRLRTRGGRVGWWGLLVLGLAFFVGGVFPPIQTDAIIGYLHGMSGLVAIFGSPIVFTLIGRNLAKDEVRFPVLRHLRWVTLATWVGLCSFLASLAVADLTGQMDIPLPPWVSLANRLMIVTYCTWLITAAWWATGSDRPLRTRNEVDHPGEAGM